MKSDFEFEQSFVEDHFQDYIEDLKAFVRIPSITQDLDPSRQAAEWVVEKLKQMGVDPIQFFETDGNPIIVGDLTSKDPTAPTVLIYGHYDVQLPDPVEEWESPAFDPELRGDYLYGRGTSDMKGQLLAVLLAIQTMQAADNLPVHLKFLIEGNEEAPPPVMEAFIPEHKAHLSADISLNCDAGMLAPDQPTICYGLRGGSICIIRVMGPVRDLHDGGYGGVIENPIHVLSKLIVGLHDEQRKITLPGFYDKVRVLSEEERAFLAALPFDESFYKKHAGVDHLWGDEDFLPIERVGARPSINVRLFKAGAKKSAIPRKAEARVGIRLVPDQDPVEAYEQLKHYVESHTPMTCSSEVEYVDGYPPYLLDRAYPASQSLREALKVAWGREPVYRLVGGGIPVVEYLRRFVGIESLLTGFSLPEDHIHGPNERLHLPTVRKGIPALIRFFHNFSMTS